MKKQIGRITLSGYAATGKSTIGKTLAKELNWEFLSVGNFAREFAEKNYGMNINEFQAKCKEDSSIDKFVDSTFIDICNGKESIVADFRLGFHFVKDSFNILLVVSEQKAFERLSKANRAGEQTDLDSIRKRNADMRQRFIESYGVDFADERNYDWVIDTSERTQPEIAKMILAAAREGL